MKYAIVQTCWSDYAVDSSTSGVSLHETKEDAEAALIVIKNKMMQEYLDSEYETREQIEEYLYIIGDMLVDGHEFWYQIVSF